jgi:N6-adenosine-specific RNA methylase IME4
MPDKKSSGVYQIIYADPPWETRRVGIPKVSHTIGGQKRDDEIRLTSLKRLPLEYNTLSIDEIKSFAVKTISDKNCALYLWTINKYLEDSYSVAREWGFKPVSLISWIKKPMGIFPGGIYAPNIEYILYCRKGNPKIIKRKDSSWFLQPRICLHSAKPSFFRDMITDVHGDVPRIELFARQKTPGWDIWGNELENTFDYWKDGVCPMIDTRTIASERKASE